MVEFKATKKTMIDTLAHHWYLLEFDKEYIVTIKKWYKRRSTGPFSQNHAINGYCQQIAEYTGHDFDYIKLYCKQKARARGYPAKTGIDGEAVPLSEAEIDTVQAGYLIDTIKEVADFLGVRLREI